MSLTVETASRNLSRPPSAHRDEKPAANFALERGSTSRSLHDRVFEFEPSRFPLMSDADSEATGRVFKAAILALRRQSAD